MGIVNWLYRAMGWGPYAEKRENERQPRASITVIPNRRELDMHHKERWAELDPKIQRRLVAVINEHVPEPEKERIALLMTDPDFPAIDETPEAVREEIHAKYGMYAPSPFHFGTGMAIRNLLRTHGCRDERLPTGNFDDYYVEALREALQPEPASAA